MLRARFLEMSLLVCEYVVDMVHVSCWSYTVAKKWRMDLRMEFAMIQCDRQTFVGVRKHSRSFMLCCQYYAGLK